MEIDLKVTRLLCSAICHDLMNKVASLSLGLETLSEDIPQQDSLGLIMKEGDMAIKQLSFFRVALGNGTGESGLSGFDGIAEARKLAKNLLATNQINLVWGDQNDTILQKVASRLNLKLLLNTILCANSCVFRNGEISIQIRNLDGDVGVLITGQGPVARLRSDFLRALHQENPVGNLTAQTVFPWYCACLAQECNAVIDAHDTGSNIQFAIVIPQQSSNDTAS